MKSILLMFFLCTFFACGDGVDRLEEEKVNVIYLDMGSDPDTATVDTVLHVKE